MAEGFEAFHVPQQSRRDKLRVIVQNQPSCEEATVTLNGCGAGLLPLYDPSLLQTDMLTCANPLGVGGRGGGGGGGGGGNPVCGYSSVVKEEGINLMGYVGGFMNTSVSSSSPSSHHYPYLDPQSSLLALNVNPNPIQDINNNNNNNPFLYTQQQQNLRDFDDHHHHESFNYGESAAHTSSGKGLSLSLSSQYYHPIPNQQQQQQLNLLGEKGIAAAGFVSRGINISNDVRNSVPLGPFTGYSSILKGSSFLKPAQQLLDDFCDVGRGIYAQTNSLDSSFIHSPFEIFDDPPPSIITSNDHHKKDTRLISMLDEVYRRYELYYQQMQAIVASFESVAGLSNAAPYKTFALKSISKQFRCLTNAITDQLRFTSKALDKGTSSKDEALRFRTTEQWVHGQRAIINLGIHENQPVWRPQRGLPERAVALLRAWLFDHFLHPYPTDTDKQMLAKQTGLSRNQVSNWFINARVRVWKPMVEEIHMLETRQTQKACDVEDQNNSKPNEPLPTSNPPSLYNQTQTNATQKAHHDHLMNHSRNELPHLPDKSNELMNFSSNNLSNHHNAGVGIGPLGGNSGVSLTLGLRQNNGIGFSEPLPMNIDHHIGLEASNDGYVIDDFEVPNRHFGKGIEGQLLRNLHC